ncbi:MAG TPA: transcription termination factor NusA [Solirubrobacterales bacterium]|nr:transcription termination factor NusA [Solirubrobacterales bacterium]
MSREIVEAIKGLEQEKGIDADTLMEALEDALLSAYKKTPGAAKYARVDLDRDTADFRVFELILPPELEEKLMAQAIEEQEQTIDPETGEMREPEDPELDPEIMAPYEDQITSRDVTPDDFGRIAAQTAKQVILQRIREAERHMMFEEYQDRVGELITGIIQQSDNRYTLVQLRERVEALLPRSEQVWNERYDHGMRVKAVITEVNAEGKGPGIVVSRRSPELIKELFELEVPEIADDLVEIVGVAREPGYRSKIAVISHTDGVDPVGACVGPRGSRVRMVVSELRGEKIDIIPYNEEPARFVAKALSPARVREVLVDDETQEATVIVPDDQLSLAIGREGQNARLAAKLTGWKVDIKSETEFSQEEEELTYEDGEDVDGRCAAVLSAGRRCPNASLQGSRYCGLPQHQALARFDTNQVTVLSDLSDAEVSVLADPNADDAQVRPLVERATAAFQAQQGEEEASEAETAAEELKEAEGEPEEAKEQAEADVQAAEQELEEAEEEAAETVEADEAEEEAEEPQESAEAEEPAADAEPAAEEESDDDVEPEVALAEDAATEGDEPSAETATVGANPSEEPKAAGEDSEGSRPEGA